MWKLYLCLPEVLPHSTSFFPVLLSRWQLLWLRFEEMLVESDLCPDLPEALALPRHVTVIGASPWMVPHLCPHLTLCPVSSLQLPRAWQS